VYAAFQAAVETTGAPTVILAQTIKGWTLGPDFEARNAVHQMKKLSSNALKSFRDRLQLDVSDEELEVTCRPTRTPARTPRWWRTSRSARGRARRVRPGAPHRVQALKLPDKDLFGALKEGSGKQEVATTMALVRLFKDLLRDKELGKRIVPIIPDEARTFGMDSWFPTAKIYDRLGQTYEPVDQDLLLTYKQAKDGQIIHEGITEAGSVGTFHAAGTSYATHGEPMIPLYIFYSMFGFQRTADSIWSAADQRARGFLIGATAGGTTLNGEGLQHQDRHSLLYAQTNPAIEAYDPSFAYELAVLVEDGLRRMYGDEEIGGDGSPGEDVIYYLTVYNEPVVQPKMPDHVDDQQIIDGLYRFKEAPGGSHAAHILSSGTIINEALRAQELLAEDWDVAADVWSAPGWNRLLRDGVAVEAWNRTNPDEDPRHAAGDPHPRGHRRALHRGLRLDAGDPVPDRRLDPRSVRRARHRRVRPLRHPRGAAPLPPHRRPLDRLLRARRAGEARPARGQGAQRGDRALRARLRPDPVLRAARRHHRRDPLNATVADGGWPGDAALWAAVVASAPLAILTARRRAAASGRRTPRRRPGRPPGRRGGGLPARSLFPAWCRDDALARIEAAGRR
jgi:hypothetical protein